MNDLTVCPYALPLNLSGKTSGNGNTTSYAITCTLHRTADYFRTSMKYAREKENRPGLQARGYNTSFEVFRAQVDCLGSPFCAFATFNLYAGSPVSHSSRSTVQTGRGSRVGQCHWSGCTEAILAGCDVSLRMRYRESDSHGYPIPPNFNNHASYVNAVYSIFSLFASRQRPAGYPCYLPFARCTTRLMILSKDDSIILLLHQQLVSSRKMHLLVP